MSSEYDAGVSTAPVRNADPSPPARTAEPDDTYNDVVDAGPVSNSEPSTEPAPSGSAGDAPAAADTAISTPRRLIIYEALSSGWALGLGRSVLDTWTKLQSDYAGMLAAQHHEVQADTNQLVRFANRYQILAALRNSRKGDIFIFHGHGARSISRGDVLLAYLIRPATISFLRTHENEIVARDIIDEVRIADAPPSVLVLSGCSTAGLLPDLVAQSGIPVVYGTTDDIDAGDATRAVLFVTALLQGKTVAAAESIANNTYSNVFRDAEFKALTPSENQRRMTLDQIEGRGSRSPAP